MECFDYFLNVKTEVTPNPGALIPAGVEIGFSVIYDYVNNNFTIDVDTTPPEYASLSGFFTVTAIYELAYPDTLPYKSTV